MEDKVKSNLRTSNTGKVVTLLPYTYFRMKQTPQQFTKRQIMKKVYTPVFNYLGNHATTRQANRILSLIGLVLAVAITTPMQINAQENEQTVIAQKPTTSSEVTSCVAPVINTIYMTHETECGIKDGSINVQIMDLNTTPSTYAVNLEHGDKGITTYSGLVPEDGVITLTNMASGIYGSFSVVREIDDCTSTLYEEDLMIRHGCDEEYEARTGCGFGTVNYTNCYYENISINLSYLVQNSYIFTRNSYIGCISYVDNDCDIQAGVEVLCMDYNLSEPTPNQGYQYGQVVFEKVVGASNYGISDLTAERINWIMCNGTSYGYSKSQMNQAIWNFTNPGYGCNTLCNLAINNVSSVQGGIADQMVFFKPVNNSSIQPFVKFACYEPSLPTPPETYVFDCDDGKTIDLYTSGANCSNVFDSHITGINDDGNVYQAVVEVVYKSTYPGSTVEVNVDGVNYSMDEVTLTGTSSNVWAYRGLVAGPVDEVYHISETGQCGSGSGLQSLIVYAFKNVPDSRALTATFTSQSGYCDEESFTFPITTDIAPRDIEVILPISELTPDGRHMVITATAGGQSASTTIFGPDATCCVASPSVTITNVPGWATSITVTVNTQPSTDPSSPQNCGQSWVMAGYAIVDVDCVDCVDPVVVDDHYDTCENTSLSGNVLDNDSNLSNQTITLTSSPMHGSVTINNDGTFTYTPTNGYYGSDQFHYTVCNEGLACCVEGVVNITVDEEPNVNVTVQNATCGDDNGTITFTFPDNPNRTTIEFSMDGGNSYPLQSADNAGSASFENLGAGTYHLYVRWGNDECPVDLGNYTITNELGPEVYITCPSDPYESRGASNSDQTCGSNNYGFYSGNLVNNYTSQKHWTVQNATFVENNGGSAILQLEAVNNSDPNLVFQIETVFRGRTFSPPAGSPKENTQCVGDVDNSDWYYYTALSGTLTGSGDLAGAVVQFVGTGASFQVGTGANLNDAAAFGASGWLALDIVSQPTTGAALIDGATGDFNLDFSGSTLVGRPDLGECLTICAGESATLMANADGGTAPLTYSWSNGETGENITVSPANTTTYYVTVTDANGCTSVDEATVTVNPTPTISANATPALCGFDVGTASASADGGTEPYTFSWSNGLEDGEQQTGLAPGTYHVTVTDANGCTATTSVTVINILGPQITASAAPTTICVGESSVLTAVATGGTAPYTYTWDNNLGEGDTKTVSPTTTTTYSVTVEDNYGCTSITSVTVTVHPNPTVSISKTDATCGDNNGTATASGSGGTAPYSYEWSDGLGTGATKTGLAPGTYTVTVEDANGCTGTNSVTINNIAGPGISASAQPEEICVGESSVITAVATGGTAPFTYTWDNNLGTGDTKTVSPTSSTTYGVTVQDANGCTASTTVTVTVHPNPTVSISKTDATCGDDNGTATASGSGGTAPYSYTWSDGLGTGATKTGLSPGTYTVTVEDANGCTGTGSVTINNIAGPGISASAQPEEICLGENSSLTATATGGTAPYTYTWDNNLGTGATKMVSPTSTTTYGVTVVDANGCEASTTVTVTVHPNPTVSISSTDATCGDNNGTVTATASGGTAPYTYAWNGGLGMGASKTGVAPGTYTVTVHDANGCSATATVTIINIGGPSVDAGDDVAICLGENTTLTATPSGGTPPYSYVWSGGASNNQNAFVGPSFTTTFSVTVTDANGCEAVDAVTVTVNPNPTVSISKTDATCGDNNGTATASGSGGTAPYTYSWSDGLGTGATKTGLAPGTYTVTVQDANGCTGSNSVTIINIPGPGITASAQPEEICVGESSVITAVATGGTAPFTYTWDNNLGTGDTKTVNPTSTTTYGVTVEDANGCEASTTVTVTVHPNPTVSISKTDATCGDDNGTATASGAGGTAPYSYTWSDGLGTGSSKTGLAPGTYTVTVED
ncbi:MAG: hypothetical protein DWQ02_24430, partial [Bacteroidetes bacterium]